MANSDLFLISFNRIEKWMRDEMGNARNMGFTELVRRLAQRKQLMIRKYEDDLLKTLTVWQNHNSLPVFLYCH